MSNLYAQAVERYGEDSSAFRGRDGKFPLNYTAFMESSLWDKKRETVIKFYTKLGLNECANCGASGVLDVHHKRYPKQWNAPIEHYAQQPVTDFTLLCKSCHGAFHRHKAAKANSEKSD